jgi:hypothetical protein
MAWTPRGYTHVIEWVDAEVARRGQELTNANWWRAFGDLADYLADEDDPEESRNALFAFESGREPHPVPLFEWRKVPDKRVELQHRRIYRNYNVMGTGSGEFGCVVIRKTLRLTDIIDIEPDQQAASQVPPAALPAPTVTPPAAGRGIVATEDLRAFLRDLDREYQGKEPPSLQTVGDLGKKRFGKTKWRKNNRDQKNAETSAGVALYPNLHCKTPGKRPKS